MPEFLSKLLEQIRGIWSNLTLARKVVLVLVGVAILAGLAALVFLSNKGLEYEPLYSNLSFEDLTDIEIELEKEKIPYQLSEDEQTILVPVNKVRRARMRLASRGLPRSESTGFGLFDESRFGMTDFTQHVQYQRALQGELANTIALIDQISEAKVHLVLPRPSVFIDEEKPAKASILLKIVPGKQLNKEHIDGIIHLVASAVEDLKAENVKLIDTSNGALLNGEEPPLAESIDDQLKYQHAVETAYKDRIINMLSPVLGSSKLTARVAIEMDFDSIEVTREEYDPYTVIESEQRVKESTERLVQVVGGLPGMPSNVNVNTDPNIEPPGLPQAQSNILRDQIPIRETREDTITAYKVGKSTLHTKKSAGGIKRITTSVIVDNKVDPTGTEQSIPWTVVELQDLENIVKGAVGYNLTRGDVVEVKNIPFFTSQLVPKKGLPLEVEDRRILYRTIAQLVFGLIVIIFAYFMILRPLFKGIGRLVAIPEGEEGLEGILAPEEEEVKGETPEELLARVLPAIATEESVDLQALRMVAEESPDQIEGLILHWLEEDM